MDAAAAAGVRFWLRGGRALDFFCGLGDARARGGRPLALPAGAERLGDLVAEAALARRQE